MQLTTRWAATGLLALTVLGLFVWHQVSNHGPTISAQRATQLATGQVVYVTDGDTINVQGVGPVRFLGIDAPETKDNSHALKGCYGITAKKRLAEILPSGTYVDLVTEGRTTDKYGRTLAYVEIGDIDVGEQLMREGMVDFYRDKSDDIVRFGRLEQYLDAWGEAERLGVGIHNPVCAP